MKKFWSILFLLLINCAVSTAQSYHFKSLDIDTGSNLITKATFNPKTKETIVTSHTFYWHKLDSFNRNKISTYFIRLDSNSNIVFNKKIEFPHENFELLGNIKLSQGNYFSYGRYYNTKEQALGLNEVSGCMILYSNTGDTLSKKIFSYGNSYSSIYTARELNDSSIVLISFLSNDSNTFTALRVIKLDTALNTLWDSVYYYSLTSNRSDPRISSFVDAIEETSDGGLIIGSSIRTRTSAIDYHGFYFKINSQGQKQWERKFEFAQDSETEVNKIIKLKDGNFLLVGFYNDFWTDPNHIDFIFLIKINPNGNILWTKFVKAYKYHFVYDALEKPNGDLLLSGTFAKGLNGFDYRAGIICVNSNGMIKWHRQYTIPSNTLISELLFSEIRDTEISNDGTIMSTGFIRVIQPSFPYNNGGNQDLIFLYTDSIGCVDPRNCTFTTVEEEQVMPLYFQVYPNPCRRKINFITNINSASSAYIKIYNNLGQLLFEKEILNFEEEVDVSTLPKGMYILELESKEFRNTQKLLIE